MKIWTAISFCPFLDFWKLVSLRLHLQTGLQTAPAELELDISRQTKQLLGFPQNTKVLQTHCCETSSIVHQSRKCSQAAGRTAQASAAAEVLSSAMMVSPATRCPSCPTQISLEKLSGKQTFLCSNKLQMKLGPEHLS